MMVVLACSGIGLILKAVMHLRNWWKDREESKRKRKEKKAQKLRKEMIDEYRKGI